MWKGVYTPWASTDGKAVSFMANCCFVGWAPVRGLAGKGCTCRCFLYLPYKGRLSQLWRHIWLDIHRKFMVGFVFLTCSNPDHMCKVGECAQRQCNIVCMNIGDLFSEYTNTGCWWMLEGEGSICYSHLNILDIRLCILKKGCNFSLESVCCSVSLVCL